MFFRRFSGYKSHPYQNLRHNRAPSLRVSAPLRSAQSERPLDALRPQKSPLRSPVYVLYLGRGVTCNIVPAIYKNAPAAAGADRAKECLVLHQNTSCVPQSQIPRSSANAFRAPSVSCASTRFASTLPSCTPSWSKLLTFHKNPWNMNLFS